MLRFRIRRPSAGMSVAFIALLAALSGTAIALPGKNTVKSDDIKNGQVNSGDIKNNDVRSKDVKNRSLLAKDFAAGQLPKGDKGDKGNPGTSVLSATVPRHQTIRGAWGISAVATLASQFLQTVVSLPVRAPTELVDPAVNMAPNVMGGDSDQACTGTAAIPTAPAGKACVYETVDDNVKGESAAAISASAGIQNTFGFTIFVQSVAAGTLDARGTWAYTAP